MFYLIKQGFENIYGEVYELSVEKAKTMFPKEDELVRK